MPKLTNTIETLDGLSERRQALYKEGNDGKFHLDSDFVPEDTSHLKTALETQKKHKTLANAEAEKLREEAEAAALKIAELENNQVEVDRIKQASLDKQKAVHDNELKDLKQKNYELTIGATRDRIAAQVYTAPERLNLSHVSERIKLAEDGVTTLLTNALGESVTEPEFIEILRADESMAFAMRGGNAGGGGKTNQDNNSGGVTSKPYSEMTTKEKIASGKSKHKHLR